VWLDISVFENDINKIKNSRGGYFISTDKSKTYGIAQYKGKLIFSGSVIDENTRTVSTIYEISNPLSEFLVGSFVTAYLNTAEAIETLAIPQSAVFDSGGRKVCFIQLGGETFEKRAIELGPEGQHYIQILAGAQEGEKVVVQGGYAVKLAAEASGKKVGEGHFH
jgi:multidrug efflux pump subunit AcrA (membrane-fusion protein)